jgi:endo-1,4-beta-xylanase
MKKLLAPFIGFSWILFSAFLSQGEPKEISLWPGSAPGSEGKTGLEKVRIAETGDHVVSNIHNPSITPYISSNNPGGTAVIIAPGGGHRELWIDHEGYNVARFFSDKGIAAFVLKYRLARDSNSTYSVEKESLADIQRAIRVVRSRAKEWKLDTAKIGVMGFSAGGELAALAAMQFDGGNKKSNDLVDRESCTPNFQALIYPGGSGKFIVAKNTPPVFLAGGYNDRPDIAEGIAQVYLKYKQAGVPAELHVYARAGHGFGMRANNHGADSHWPERFIEWLNDMGMLKPRN